MNQKISRYFGILLFTAVSFSFTSDNCNPYFPIQKGNVWEYEELDKKGEVSGISKTEVIDETVDGKKTVFKIKGTTDGPKMKEKNHHEMEMDWICENGVLKMSMDNIIPKETMDGMKDMDIEVTQSGINIPSNLNVGDKLDDAKVNFKASTNGISVMNMTITQTDRVIEKMEEVTTSAGTFNCAVLYYKITTDMGMMKRESSSRDWYSPKVGVVKSEGYDKNGNLQFGRRLKSYTNGG